MSDFACVHVGFIISDEIYIILYLTTCFKMFNFYIKRMLYDKNSKYFIYAVAIHAMLEDLISNCSS